MFRFEAAVRLGLTNPASTSTVNEWLPCHKEVAPVINREDFGERGKKKRSLVSTPKKNCNPVEDTNRKLLSLSDIATAIEDIAPESTVFTVVPKPKVDFLKEILDKSSEKPSDLATITDKNCMDNCERWRCNWHHKQLKTLLRDHMVKLQIISLYKYIKT